MAGAIRVEGLQKFRRSLRATDRDAAKAVQAVTKRAAGLVADEARSLAPRRSGRLAASIRATTAGAKGVVRSPLPYAKVHEYGGTIRPKGTPIMIKRSLYVHRAMDRKADDVLNELARGFERVVQRDWS